ncbi:MAG: 5'/3'-nucleotidase SurE [Aestuariivita sp.]|nr:5'/3'-nucleotidase SurE [Aestuariivita sp.]
MRILITNDDGINAPGLNALKKIANKIADPDGEVWIVAPTSEKSGVGHCISLTKPILSSQLGPQKYAVDGNPADCVIAGLHYVMKENPPDLILSGVNRGNNSAENALYSGTLGAALEGALQGIPSIALSQYLGPKNYNIDDPFEASHKYGAELIQKILSENISSRNNYNTFYNINFPPCPAKDVKGVQVTPQGLRKNNHFTIELTKTPSMRELLFVKGGDQQICAQPGSDADANLNGYISVTPMIADLTDYASLEALKKIE